MQKVKDFIVNNKWVQYFIVLIIGVAIGAIFYPSKRIEEKVRQQYEEKITTMQAESSKTIKELSEKVNIVTNERHQSELSYERKISVLNTQIKDLTAKTKETYYKIVKPDGTIEEKKYTEQDINEQTKTVTSIQEEFTKKVKELEDKWTTVHKERTEQMRQDYDKQISEYKDRINKLESSKVVEVNKRSFGIYGGATLRKDFYSHITYDIFGPISIGAYMSTNTDLTMNAGLGVGIRF